MEAWKTITRIIPSQEKKSNTGEITQYLISKCAVEP